MTRFVDPGAKPTMSELPAPKRHWGVPYKTAYDIPLPLPAPPRPGTHESDLWRNGIIDHIHGSATKAMTGWTDEDLAEYNAARHWSLHAQASCPYGHTSTSLMQYSADTLLRSTCVWCRGKAEARRPT